MTLLNLRPNAANILRWCLHLRSRDIDDEGKDKAAKLYMLAGSFPEIPAGILLDLVEGRMTADAMLAASSFPIHTDGTTYCPESAPLAVANEETP